MISHIKRLFRIKKEVEIQNSKNQKTINDIGKFFREKPQEMIEQRLKEERSKL